MTWHDDVGMDKEAFVFLTKEEAVENEVFVNGAGEEVDPIDNGNGEEV